PVVGEGSASKSQSGKLRFLTLYPGSGEDVCQGVFWQWVRLQLGPVGGRRRLRVTGCLHLRRALGGEPSPFDHPGSKSGDRVVSRRLGELFLGPVLEVVVFGGVRVDAPDLRVDQGWPFAAPGTRHGLAAGFVAGR